MSDKKFMGGLDLGTHTTQVVIGQKSDSGNTVEIISVFEVPSEGIRKGVVVDVGAAAETMKYAVEKAHEIVGHPVDEYFVSFSGTHINASENVGSIIVSRADKEISESEKERVMGVAQAVTLSSNREILDVIPLRYIVDQDQVVKEPLGMKGTKLELKTLIIHGSTPHIKNWEKSLMEAGISAVGRIFSNLASSRSVLSKNQKELGAAVLDIGGSISGFTVYEEGDILHTVVLPVGSSHITNDLAIGLKINVDVAEKLKLEYGCLAGDVSRKGVIDLSEYGEEGVKISRKEMADIIRIRLEELFIIVNKELKKIGREKLLPGGVVLVGGGSKISGIVDFAKDQLKLPVQIGYPRGIEGVSDKVDDPSYATAVGLVLMGFDEISKNAYNSRMFSSGIFRRIFKALKKLMP